MQIFRRRQQTPQHISIGTVLSNRYRLDSQLGEGGAGIVYKAQDQQLERTVAIKVLNASGGMAAGKMERFQSEARSVARLNHPNIVTLYDYAEENGRPYLVMEYIPGKDLWAVDNSYSPNLMPFTDSLPIIDGILAALEYSHQHAVIHRDLKPENVMITPDHLVKVMDFGLARIEGQSRLTQEGLVAGTASYLAPELALGEPGDHRVDLYALGVMIYELLTGRRPFSDQDPLTVISQHIHAPVVPPQHYNPNIPDQLQRIIMKLLSKQPDERYQNATLTRRDLAQVLSFIQGDNQEAVPHDSLNQPRLPSTTTPVNTQQVLLERIARGKMIGRVEQLNDLKRRWDSARLGEEAGERLILLSGEGGIGKTRLLDELAVYSKLRDGYVLRDRAQEEDIGRPYSMFANAISGYIQEQPIQILRRQMNGQIAGELVKLVPQLSEKLNYIPPNPHLEPEAERERLLQEVSQFVLNLAYENPTLLLLDDLHFADTGSLDLLATLVQNAQGASLLVVAAYRDVALSYTNPINNFIAEMTKDHLIYYQNLYRLTEEMVGDMLEALLGNSVNDGFVKSIYTATEGNPLYIEEVIKGLAVDGQIYLKDGQWQQREADRLHVPVSIRAVLGSRFERVSKPALELLQLASALGRDFSVDVLREASPHEDVTIQKGLSEAVRTQLVELKQSSGKPSTSGSYQFQHAIIRETLYEELRPLRKRQLHRRLATTYQAYQEAQRINNPSLIAHHLIASAQDEQAVPYLRQAGEDATQIYANGQAIRFFSQAREILEDIAPDLVDDEVGLRQNLTEQFELLTSERAILTMLGERDRELTTLEQMEHVAKQLDDQQRWVGVLGRMASYYWQIGKLDQGWDVAQQGFRTARKTGDKIGEGFCLEQMARILWTKRDPESMEYAIQSLTIAQEQQNRGRESRLKELIGHIYTDTLYDAPKAQQYFDDALTISQDLSDKAEEAWTLWGMGKLALFVDDYELALNRYNEAKSISERIGANLQFGWSLYHLGDAWYQLGNYEQALKSYSGARKIFDKSNHLRGQIFVHISLGLVNVALNQFEEAGPLYEEGRRRAEELNDLALMFQIYEALSAFYRLAGGENNITYAIRLSNRIIRLARDGKYPEHEMLGHYLRAAGFYTLGDLTDALESSNQAVAKLEQYSGFTQSVQISIAEILYRHSRILAAARQDNLAYTYLQRAYEETLRKGNLIRDEQLREKFLYEIPLNRKILRAFSRR